MKIKNIIEILNKEEEFKYKLNFLKDRMRGFQTLSEEGKVLLYTKITDYEIERYKNFYARYTQLEKEYNDWLESDI